MTEGSELTVPDDDDDVTNKEDDDLELPVPEALVEEAGGKEVVSKIIAIYEETFSGPLPHPKIFAQYKAVMPDAPERIFRMAERQQEHRFGLENSVIQGDVRRADLGLRLGFVLFFILAVGAIFLLATGKQLEGYSVLAASIIGGIANFIRVGQEREKHNQKDPPKKPPKKRRRKR